MLFLIFVAYGQQLKRVAIMGTVDDEEPPLKVSELNQLTSRLRSIATDVLPQSYAVMTQQSIVDYFGSQDAAAKKCRQSECLAQLGRQVNADYVGQGRIGRFGKDYSINFELYEVKKGTLVSSFDGYAKDIYGLLAIINEKTPALFKKLPGASGGGKTGATAPSVPGGISGVRSADDDYAPELDRFHLVNISTEPAGAVLSFNGEPISGCAQSPCKAQLAEGQIRIVAVLDQYERLDTTVSVRQSNQNVSMKLKSNFGILEVKPAYSDGIGKSEGWSLSINGKAVSSYENRMSPGKYNVKLSHRCYEDIDFDAGINKGSREVFDMSQHIKLRRGGLVLSAEKDGQPTGEPVFIDGKQSGETPFSGTVAVCSEVAIGNSKEKVNVKLEYKQTVRYTHKVASGGGDMVFVKGGTFTMGCTKEQGSDCGSDEKPSHKVTVGDFYIGKYEVTQKEWEEVMGSNPSGFSNCGDNCPVENVSWNDIQEFIRKLNVKTGKKYRLPTEAEWEYAARGGNQSKGYKYSSSNNLDAVAWYTSNSGNKTHSVGTKQPNELGIYDMSGNVWEWVSDWYGNYSSTAASNPKGPISGSHHVNRGGSWSYNAKGCRVANRDGDGPDRRSNSVGFRLALSP